MKWDVDLCLIRFSLLSIGTIARNAKGAAAACFIVDVRMDFYVFDLHVRLMIQYRGTLRKDSLFIDLPCRVDRHVIIIPKSRYRIFQFIRFHVKFSSSRRDHGGCLPVSTVIRVGL